MLVELRRLASITVEGLRDAIGNWTEMGERERRAIRRQIEREGSRRFAHMMSEHADWSCSSQRKYLLGLSESDPHPERKVVITPCKCRGEILSGYKSFDLGLPTPMFRHDKLAPLEPQPLPR